MARCAVPASVQRAERVLDDMRNRSSYCAAERGADGAARRQRAVPTRWYSRRRVYCFFSGGFALRRLFISELMNQPDSQDLLAEYVRNGSESAFRELVTRYLDLVYSTAVRCVAGDTHQAEDVAQTVFLDLARLASRLSKDTMLGGWLHRHTCYVASTLMRGQRRRLARERQAVEMNSLNERDDPGLAQLTPLLDAAINELEDEDRKAILLRFYERLDLRTVGLALGSSENAAQKRVSRALDQLHSILTRRGVTISVTALSALLAAEAVTAAPVGLAAGIVSSAVAGAAAGAGISVALIKLSALTKLKVGVAAAALVASVVTPLWWQHRAELKLRAENELLRQQLAQNSQAPPEPEPQFQPMEAATVTPAPPRRSPPAATLLPREDINPSAAEFRSSVAPPAVTMVPVPVAALGSTGKQFTRFYASAGSTMKMDGKSNIHDWQAESDLIGGFLEVGPTFPIEPWRKANPGRVEAHAESFVMVQSLKSVDQHGRPYSDRMDELLHTALKARDHPKIRYHLTELTLTQPAKSSDLPNMFEAKGELVVAGATNSITMPLSVLPTKEKKLKLSGSTTVKMTDFQIDPSSPDVGLGQVRVEDEVKLTFVWILSQRSQTSASGTGRDDGAL